MSQRAEASRVPYMFFFSENSLLQLPGRSLLVTGIAGCVGGRVAALAQKRGMIVRGLQRSPDKASRVAKQLGVEVITGDISDPKAATEARRGMDFVVHTAALVTDRGPLKEFRRINVIGSATMAEAARDAGVTTFVQISSVLVYGIQYPDDVAEDGPFYSGKSHYCLTKLESERAVLKLHDPTNMRVVAIRAGDVYGPESQPWVVRPLELMRTGEFKLLNGGRGICNHIYVDNLVDGIFLAIERDAAGDAINLTDGQRTTWKEYYTRLARIGGLSDHFISLPAWLTKLTVSIIPGYQSTREAIDFSTRKNAYSVRKAADVLGFFPRVSLDEGMERTRAWLQKQ